MGRGGEQFQRRWRLRLQLLVDIDNAEARVVAEIAGIRDERAAQHRVGALDCGRIAAAGLGRRAGQSTNIVAAGVEVVGLGGSQELDQLSGGRPGRPSEPQGRAAAGAVEFGNLSVQRHRSRRPCL